MGQVPQGLAPILRVLQTVRPWSMTQVFMLGVLVSLVKLAHLAHVVPGIGLWSVGGLILLLTAAVSSFNLHDLWNLVREDE
jgi:paraquat-inducible protein A